MRKLLCIIICLVGLTACSAGALSEKYNEALLTSSSEKVLSYLQQSDYDSIIKMSSEQLKQVITIQMIQEAWEPLVDKVGNYEDECTVTTFEEDGYGVAVLKANYEDGTIQLTLSYNTDMELEGLYIK